MSDAGEVPPWAARIDRALSAAARDVRLIGSVTPLGASRERKRLIALFEEGGAALPSWSYAAVDLAPQRRAIAGALRELSSASPSALARCYLDRAIEMDLEASIACAAGTPNLAPLALRRFGESDHVLTAEARRMAEAWLGEAREETKAQTASSDGPEDGSLVSSLRREIGRLRLPFTVAVHPELAPLAATGERSILVAPARALSDEDVRRTVLHEVHGHALPRARAATLPLGIFSFATARGTDEQEGYALLLEERAGLLSQPRRRQLAARHLAAFAMDDGATFADAARMLIDVHGVAPADAVYACERAFRGGDGSRGGLGRERVYLESLLRVREHLALFADDERVLSAGQVAVGAVSALRAFT